MESVEFLALSTRPGIPLAALSMVYPPSSGFQFFSTSSLVIKEQITTNNFDE